MRPVVLVAQSNPADPLINEPSILPSADMIGMIDTAWKDEVVERAAAAFEPCQNTAASGFEELELNGSASLLLNDNRAFTKRATTDEIFLTLTTLYPGAYCRSRDQTSRGLEAAALDLART